MRPLGYLSTMCLLTRRPGIPDLQLGRDPLWLRTRLSAALRRLVTNCRLLTARQCAATLTPCRIAGGAVKSVDELVGLEVDSAQPRTQRRVVGKGNRVWCGFHGDCYNGELPAGGECVVEVGQRYQVTGIEDWVGVGDHPHGQVRLDGAGVCHQLAQVRVIGRSELGLDDHESVMLIPCGKVDTHPSDGLFMAAPAGDGPPLADDDLPTGALQPLHAQAGCKLVEIVGQPTGEVGFPRPPLAGVADDLATAGLADAGAEDAIRCVHGGPILTGGSWHFRRRRS